MCAHSSESCLISSRHSLAKVRNHIIAGTKRRVLKEGVLLEKFTFDDWIRHIEGMK